MHCQLVWYILVHKKASTYHICITAAMGVEEAHRIQCCYDTIETGAASSEAERADELPSVHIESLGDWIAYRARYRQPEPYLDLWQSLQFNGHVHYTGPNYDGFD